MPNLIQFIPTGAKVLGRKVILGLGLSIVEQGE